MIPLETIDQTETGRRWLTTFTFLRLQILSSGGATIPKIQGGNAISKIIAMHGMFFAGGNNDGQDRTTDRREDK